MVRKPKFKLIAKGEDITEKLSKNLVYGFSRKAGERCEHPCI